MSHMDSSPTVATENTQGQYRESDRDCEIHECMEQAHSCTLFCDFDQALKLYNKAQESCATLPEAEIVRSRIRMHEAVVYLNQGRHKMAEDQLKRLRKQKVLADEGETVYHLAVVLIRQGKHQDALQELQFLHDLEWFKDARGSLSNGAVGPQLTEQMLDVTIATAQLLALHWGHYGRFDMASVEIKRAWNLLERFPQEPDLIQGRSPGQVPIDREAIKARIELAEAKLRMAQGQDNAALEITRPLCDRLKTRYSDKYLLFLEAASIHAVLLSRTFDREAEASCASTIQAMMQHLAGHRNDLPLTKETQNAVDKDSYDHPLTMEAQSTLADIFLAHARPYEALDTVAALWKQAKRTLDEHHPQTLRYCFQLGGIELYIGNYVRSMEFLQSVYDEANAKWGGTKLTDDKATRSSKRRRLGDVADQESDKMSTLGQHPDVLSYLSKLAVANYCLGNLDMAKDQARRALTGLADVYSTASTKTHDRDIIDVLKEFGFSYKDRQTIIPHPDVLESLANFAGILKNEVDWKQAAIKALGVVYKKNKDCHGSYHPTSLRSSLLLGLARLDDGADMAEMADHFQRLSEDCERSLGADHITTLRARLGELFVRLLKSESRLSKAKFKSLASGIMDNQIRLLGDHHPLVLDSFVRLFAVELMLDDGDAHTRAKHILAKLRQPAIRKQRLLESLKCEAKIADLYCTAKEDYEHSLPIYQSIIGVLETSIIQAQGDRLKWLEGRVQYFKKAVDKSLQRARADAQARYSTEMEKANRARNGPDQGRTEVAQRRVSTLAKVLYGERDPKTIGAVRQLAADLENMEDEEKRLEGAAILDELNNREAQEHKA